MEQFRLLSMEKSGLETQRSTLERQASSIREDVRETVDSNITLKNKLAAQNDLIVSYEKEIERLTQALSTMQNQVQILTERDKSSQADLIASRDMMFTLETKMDKLKLDLANSDGTRAKVSKSVKKV